MDRGAGRKKKSLDHLFFGRVSPQSNCLLTLFADGPSQSLGIARRVREPSVRVIRPGTSPSSPPLPHSVLYQLRSASRPLDAPSPDLEGARISRPAGSRIGCVTVERVLAPLIECQLRRVVSVPRSLRLRLSASDVLSQGERPNVRSVLSGQLHKMRRAARAEKVERIVARLAGSANCAAARTPMIAETSNAVGRTVAPSGASRHDDWRSIGDAAETILSALSAGRLATVSRERSS